MKEKSTRRMILLSVLFLALVVGITLVCLPYITRLSEPDFQAAFKEWVSDMGVFGLLVVFGIQVLQIVIQCRQLSEQKALKHGFSAVMETHIARYFAG